MRTTAAPTLAEAKVEILALAEVIHATKRGASLPAAYELACVQRPDLSAVLDAHGVAPPSVVLLSERSKSKQSAHEQLVALAEEYCSSHPTVTREQAYLVSWQSHPSVVAELAEQQRAEMRSANLAEHARIGSVFAADGPGQQRGYNASSQRSLTPTIPGDMAAGHDVWMKRAYELLKAGRYPTIEQSYVAAMKGL
jgi:hypothetical protein